MLFLGFVQALFPFWGYIALSAHITAGTTDRTTDYSPLCFQLHFRPLVFIELLVFLLPDVAITLDPLPPSYAGCLPPKYQVISHHHLISLDLEVPLDLSFVILNPVRRLLPTLFPSCFCILYQPLGCDAPSMPYVPASCKLHPGCTVSGASLHSIHPGSCLVW